MAKQVAEFEIKFDNSEYIDNVVRAEQALKGLKDQQKELKKSNQENTEQYKDLTKEITRQNSILQENKRGVKDIENANKAATGSIREQRERLKELKRQWVEQGTATEEGKKRQEALGKEVKELTDNLKKQEKAVGDNRRNVGNYTESVTEALEAQGGFVGGVISLVKNLTPLQAGLGTAAAAVAFLGTRYTRTAKGQREFAQAQGALKVITEDVIDANLRQSGLMAFMDRVMGSLASTTNERAKAAGNLILAEQELALLEADRFIQEKESMKLQEDQRQIRDDITVSIHDRIAANEELGRLQVEQLEAELDLVEQTITIAQTRIDLEGDSIENQVLLKQALGQRADVEERINGQQSEQITNARALNVELQEQIDLNNQLRQEQAQQEADLTAGLEVELKSRFDIWNEDLEKQTLARQNQKMELKKFDEEASDENIDRINAERKAEEEAQAAILNARLNALSTISSQLASVAGENSETQKAFAIIQATIDTWTAATAALSPVTGLGPVLGPALAAATIAAGFANIAKIQSAKDGALWFGDGGKAGVFGGKPHSSGGTKGMFSDGTRVEVERDEAFVVVNKKDTPLLSALSDINSIHGKGFMRDGGSMYFQDGGAVSRFSAGTVSADVANTAAVRSAIESLPNPVVFVEDIRQGVSSQVIVEDRASA